MQRPTSDSPLDGAADARPAPCGMPAGPAQLDTRELFRHGREVVIVHGNEAYRLKLTRQDKLILTK